jgi:hypothetical protein
MVTSSEISIAPQQYSLAGEYDFLGGFVDAPVNQLAQFPDMLRQRMLATRLAIEGIGRNRVHSICATAAEFPGA